ncbi:UPF0739 protein C1orf74 homolog [Pseudophryne corroboree]|uniref:UPF0739 protein C1orf74 homolog n=1 Tax=Pseudophryne corroboree TaxID=495146 RepID=UPI0030817744
MSLIKDLHSAAKNHLKGLKRSLVLKLAAEILSVDCGLKPCFLYDFSAADMLQILNYLKELQKMGFIKGPLHLLTMEENILILNVSRVVSFLKILLQSKDLHVMDVSAQLKQPKIFGQDQLCHIRPHISDLLTHLRPYLGEQPGSITVTELPCSEWNLCTMFGLLLHYPAVYWFDTTRNFENCLSLMPLKRFIVQTTCPKIELHKFQLYSFTIPELIYPSLQSPLQTWSKDVRRVFHEQGHFTDLEIITETVTLPAVAL